MASTSSAGAHVADVMVEPATESAVHAPLPQRQELIGSASAQVCQTGQVINTDESCANKEVNRHGAVAADSSTVPCDADAACDPTRAIDACAAHARRRVGRDARSPHLRTNTAQAAHTVNRTDMQIPTHIEEHQQRTQ